MPAGLAAELAGLGGMAGGSGRRRPWKKRITDLERKLDQVLDAVGKNMRELDGQTDYRLARNEVGRLRRWWGLRRRRFRCSASNPGARWRSEAVLVLTAAIHAGRRGQPGVQR